MVWPSVPQVVDGACTKVTPTVSFVHRCVHSRTYDETAVVGQYRNSDTLLLHLFITSINRSCYLVPSLPPSLLCDRAVLLTLDVESDLSLSYYPP